MALGSLVDAGADLDEIRAALSVLPVGGWSLEAQPVLRAGLAATQILVHVRDSPVVRTHSHIAGLISEARLPERAKARALATFELLAEVEGRLHRRPPSQVHFHEVGGVDAIVDIVGTCIALDLLGVDEIYASPVAQGTGVVRAAHGLLPNPTPAVVELLRGAPTYGTDNPAELTTPTGAAILAALGSGWGPMPAMDVVTVGRGAGGRDTDGVPNLVQVVIGQRADERPAGGADAGQELVLLESNVDDVTGEILAHTIESAMNAGANDAWLTPVLGKKGRPAQVISIVVEPLHAAELRRLLIAETGTLGVRAQPLRRWAATRQMGEVEVEGHAVRVKRSSVRVKAEHADVARVAALTGLPAREVARRAESSAHTESPSVAESSAQAESSVYTRSPADAESSAHAHAHAGGDADHRAVPPDGTAPPDPPADSEAEAARRAVGSVHPVGDADGHAPPDATTSHPPADGAGAGRPAPDGPAPT